MPLETFGVSPLYLTEQFHQTYAEKSFLNLVNPNQMWIVITIFRLILIQTEFCIYLYIQIFPCVQEVPDLASSLGHIVGAIVKMETLTLADVSRHNRGPIKGPLKPLNTIALWCTGSSRRALNWASMMPTDESLSGQLCVWPVRFSQSRVVVGIDVKLA